MSEYPYFDVRFYFLGCWLIGAPRVVVACKALPLEYELLIVHRELLILHRKEVWPNIKTRV